MNLHERPRGFVLVGVVMLVLALTILGLSLFSLSSYEAQFFGGSQEMEQAFQAAQGGIERAKYALAIRPNNLEQVKNSIPGLEYVTEVTAKQWQVSRGDTVQTGPIEFDTGEPVFLSVTAQYDGAMRTAQGYFEPHKPESYYKRLITSADSVGVNPRVNYDPAGTPRADMVHLLGGPRLNFWQVRHDTLRWTYNVASYLPTGVAWHAVPIPLVKEFIDTHAGVAPARSPDASGYKVELPGVAGDVTYYHSRDPSPDGHPLYSYHEPGELLIRVGGCVVWMIDQGLRCENLTKVEMMAGSVNPCLVIVAGKNKREPAPYDLGGIWFFGGLRSLQVPVILVSDGGIYIEHFNNQIVNEDQTTIVNALSMYGRYVLLTGPLQGPYPMRLKYSQSTMDDLVDYLSSKGALPNASAASATFALRAGTWRAPRP